MNLDELQSAQSRERQTDSLQQLRESFYADAGEFVQQLRTERDRAAERADDPFDAPEVNRLTDDINTAEQTVEAIYERRVGKIVKMASLAAADMPTEDEGLTAEEQDLFETLVTAIEDNREHVLDVLAGETPADTGAPAGGREEPEDASPESTASEPRGTAATDATDSAPDGSATTDPAPPAPEQTPPQRDRESAEPTRESSGAGRESTNPDRGSPSASATGSGGPAEVDAADVMGSGPEEAGSEQPRSETDGGKRESAGARGGDERTAGQRSESPSVERQTVRIVDDVGPIYGVDEREYDLSSDDVVQLPAANADPLLQRGAAERID